MPEHFVRVTRTALVAVFLAVAAGACDSSTDIPTAPEGPIPFNAVAFNTSTLQPAPGTSVSAGTTGNTFHVDLAYQITPEEFNQGGNPFFYFWIETWSGDGASWEGDLREDVVFADQQTGVRTFEGTFSAPTTSPFCSAYGELAIAAWLWTATNPPTDDPNLDPDDEKTAAGSTVDRVFLDVDGATGTTANCMQHIVSHDRFTWWWGEDIVFWARNIDPAANVQFLVGPGGEEGTIITDGYFPNGESGYAVWLPAGTDGQVRMLVDGVEVPVYGANRPTSIDYDGDEDIFWPNDAFDDAAFDYIANSWFGPSVFAWNPSLSIHAPEQEVDASANPLGSEMWMLGDWYSIWLDDIDAATTVDVCSYIFFDATDDLDLMIFDDQGNQLAASTAPVGATVEFVRVDGVAGGTELRLWVAPYDLTTESGVYEVFSVDCSLLASPAALTEMPEPGPFLRPELQGRPGSLSPDLLRSSSRVGDQVRTAGSLKDEIEIR